MTPPTRTLRNKAVSFVCLCPFASVDSPRSLQTLPTHLWHVTQRQHWCLRLCPDKFWFRGASRKTHWIKTPQISPFEKAKVKKKWIEKKANWTPMEKDSVSRSPWAFHPGWKEPFGRSKMGHHIYNFMLGNKFLRGQLKALKSALPRRKLRAKENVGWDATTFQTSWATGQSYLGCMKLTSERKWDWLKN